MRRRSLKGGDARQRLAAAACWSLTAAVAAWALVRLFGLERGYPLVQLVAFTPYVVLVGLAVLVLDAVLRRWWAAAVAGLAVGGLALSVAPRAVGDGDPADGPRLRVMTANLHFGNVPARELVGAVRRERVDILSLQELPPSMVRRLRRAGLQRWLPQAVVEARPGADGTGLFARVALRARPPIQGTLGPEAVADAEWRGRRFEVVAVHPPPPTRRRLSLWTRGLRQLPRAGDGRSRILAGDFNATLDHAELRDLLESGYRDAAEAVGAGLHTTWPRGRRWPPEVTIDHVLADRSWTVDDVRFVSLPGTDHRALVAELAAG